MGPAALVLAMAFQTCLPQAAAAYGVPLRALQAIRQVEGGHPGMFHGNRDGSVDLGPMQINSRWLQDPDVRNVGLNAQQIAENPCLNAYMAAWILRLNLDADHGDLWQAVGDYHSHTPAEHWRYRHRVRQVYQKIATPY